MNEPALVVGKALKKNAVLFVEEQHGEGGVFIVYAEIPFKMPAVRQAESMVAERRFFHGEGGAVNKAAVRSFQKAVRQRTRGSVCINFERQTAGADRTSRQTAVCLVVEIHGVVEHEDLSVLRFERKQHGCSFVKQMQPVPDEGGKKQGQNCGAQGKGQSLPQKGSVRDVGSMGTAGECVTFVFHPESGEKQAETGNPQRQDFGAEGEGRHVVQYDVVYDEGQSSEEKHGSVDGRGGVVFLGAGPRSESAHACGKKVQGDKIFQRAQMPQRQKNEGGCCKFRRPGTGGA